MKLLEMKKLHFGAACMTVILMSMMITSAVHAGTSGLIKIEQAKVKFSANDYRGALSILEEAILDAPENGDAYHYAGLCEMALGHEDSALEYLLKAQKIKPQNSGVHADVAGAALETGDYGLALKASGKALEIDSANTRARYFQGRALLGQKDYETAYSVFQAVGTSDEYSQEGMFYSGLCLMKMGKEEDALNSFKAANSADPDSPIGIEAARYLSGQGGDDKPWNVRLRLLYQYDSNILPAKDEESLPDGIDELDDYRFVTDVDARYDFLRGGDYGARVRWVGYASFHSTEDQLNVIYNMGEVSGYYDIEAGVPVKLAASVDYAAASIDGDAYSAAMKITPEILTYWTDSVVTRLVVDYIDESFDEDTLETLGVSIEEEDDRDNTRVSVSLIQHLFVMDNNVNLYVGYRWSQVDADGDNYNRDDNGALAGVISALPMDSLMALTYKYEDRDYPDIDRHDYVNQVNVSYQIPVWKWVNIYTSAVFRDVNSNVDDLEYYREVYTLGILADL